MNELSRVSRQSQIEQARRARYSMEPTFDSLEFDDWMENIESVGQELWFKVHDIPGVFCVTSALYSEPRELFFPSFFDSLFFVINTLTN